MTTGAGATPAATGNATCRPSRASRSSTEWATDATRSGWRAWRLPLQRQTGSVRIDRNTQRDKGDARDHYKHQKPHVHGIRIGHVSTLLCFLHVRETARDGGLIASVLSD